MSGVSVRFRREGGRVPASINTRPSEESRFFSKVYKTESCWIWMAERQTGMAVSPTSTSGRCGPTVGFTSEKTGRFLTAFSWTISVEIGRA
jgi:hypothetical protein